MNATDSIDAKRVDQILWEQGFIMSMLDPTRKNMKVPHELDFLHGFHDSQTLAILSSWLTIETARNVRLTSYWQDKHVYVLPKVKRRTLARRELADLAVIVRFANRTADTIMWLLQAKTNDEPLAAFTGPSSKKEIDLFENIRTFEVIDTSNKSYGSFDLSMFGEDPSHFKHWSFLLFHRTPSTLSADDSPMQWRWAGSTTTTPAVGSFASALLDIVNLSPDAKGSFVSLGETDEWSLLYRALFGLALVKPTTGHARTETLNAAGSVLQFITEPKFMDSNLYH